MVYVILENADALRLAAEVNRHLAEGWRRSAASRATSTR
jgi:hypothetical protein